MEMQRGRCEMHLVRTLSTVGHINFRAGSGGGGLSLGEKVRKEDEYKVLRVTQNMRAAATRALTQKTKKMPSEKSCDGGGRDTCKLTKLM